MRAFVCPHSRVCGHAGRARSAQLGSQHVNTWVAQPVGQRCRRAAGSARVSSVPKQRVAQSIDQRQEETSVSHPHGQSVDVSNGAAHGNGVAKTPAVVSSVPEPEKALEEIKEVEKIETRGESLAGWAAAAFLFGAGIWAVQGPEPAQEYFAGYLLEQTLSIDNLFVFILVFNYFKTPPRFQSKVLTWGLVTAAVLRLIMIELGVELVESFRPLLLLFAGIVLFSSYKLLFMDEDGNEDLSQNAIVKLCKRLIPVSMNYDRDKFFTIENGTRVATPMLLTLAVVELSDVLFAVDSIPAVFGVTLDPFIIYTSNIFAILSLRSLYAFVATAMAELRYLDKAVALVLGFVGIKLLGDFVHLDIPTDVSLGIVAALLGGGVAASLLLPNEESD